MSDKKSKKKESKDTKKNENQEKNSFDKQFDDISKDYGVDYDSAGGGFKEDPNVAKDNLLPVDLNATEPEKLVVKGQNGGRRPGAGRPKGSKNQFSKHSVERLKELNFDPMAAMVELYHETAQIIREMEDPNHPRRYSAPALASLIINKQKIVNDLMRYGYRFVPDKEQEEEKEKQPFQIQLTGLGAESQVKVIAPMDGDFKDVTPDKEDTKDEDE
jgi:hypothetical protein